MNHSGLKRGKNHIIVKLDYRIDANTTALLIRAALDNFLTKSPLFAQWAFIAQNGMEIAPKSTVFSTIFNNGNL